MAYARVTIRYADKTSATAEVGHPDAHPDLLDELVSRCRDLFRQTIDDDEGAEVETGEDEA